MRPLAFMIACSLAAAVGQAAHAQTVQVRLGDELRRDSDDLGVREVRQQADRLGQVVEAALRRRGGFEGARIELELIDVRPTRPTHEQIRRQPGLDPIRSVSIGGAEIRGRVVLADGSVREIDPFEYRTHTVTEVIGFSTWRDAERAYDRFAAGLASGRLL